MYIDFQNIEFKNLLSVGADPVKINFKAASTTLISGSNGAGKSLVIDALHFALYGKPFRKIVKNQLVNNINKKNCLVTLRFNIGNKKYKIERGIKPNIFNIFCDNKRLDNDASAVDFQKELELSILKMSRETFRQIVVLGSTSYVPFMRLNSRDRNLIVEDLLDIQIFSKMLIILKQKLSQGKRNLVDIVHQIDIKNNSINYTESHINNMLSNNQKSEEELLSKKVTIDENIKNFQSQKEKLTKMLVENSLDDSILKEKKKIRDDIVKLNYALNSKIDKLNEDIVKFEQMGICPTCDQDIPDNVKDEKIAELKNNKDEISNKVKDNSKMVHKADENISKTESHLKKLNELALTIKEIELKIDSEKRLKASLQSSKKEIDLDDSKSKLEKLQTKLAAFTSEENSLRTIIEEFEFIQEILNENGIRSSIIKTYLPIINKIIKKYLKILEFDIQFEFDETFTEKIKFAGREDVNYFGLSEGQKLRLDLCLLFAFRDVSKLKNSTSCNLLIFDEIGDSSLDNEGFEAFLRILSDSTSQGNNIFVISHNNELQSRDILDRALEFKKDGIFTEIQEEI